MWRAVLLLGAAIVGCDGKHSDPTTAAPTVQPDDPKLAKLLDEYESEMSIYEQAATAHLAAKPLSEEWAKATGAFGQAQAKLLQIVQSIREARATGASASPAQAERLKRLSERQEAVSRKINPPKDAGSK
jgi:hypothetical protein